MLTLAMLDDVLQTLKASVVDKIVVVGEDAQVQKKAEQFGAFYRFANGATLNSAVEEATLYCVEKGAQSILVLLADVPLVNCEEINRIIQLADDGTSAVVLSPSHDWGTNVVYQSPPKLIPACFGTESFIRHIRAGLRNGVSVRLHLSNQLAADIDSPEDLKKIFEIKNMTVSKRFLEQINFNRKLA